VAGAFLGGGIYAVGGRRGSLATNTGRVDVYEPGAGAWRRAPDAPTPRGGIAAASFAGRVFVYGGEASGGTFAQTEAYDPATAAWESLVPMPTARHGLGAAVAPDGVHVLAGGPRPGFTYSGAHERMRPAG
jgi:hypothetical protein